MKLFRVWEGVAVVFSLAFTYLIGIGSVWCWPFAILSGLLYTALCYNRKIYAEAFLHFFYFGMGIYGWLHWGKGTENGFTQHLSVYIHLAVIPLLFGLTILSGYLLKKYTTSKAGYVDSFTTIFSVWATFLMVQLYLENWWYFIVINAVAIGLYSYRKMYLTAALMAIYIVMSIKGYWEWTHM